MAEQQTMCEDIRNNRISRHKGVYLVKKFDRVKISGIILKNS